MNPEIQFIPPSNEQLQLAASLANVMSLDEGHKTGAVIIKDKKLVGIGWNGSAWHEIKGFCERKKQGVKTGTRYELCAGCDPHFHAERRAIRYAVENKYDLEGAEMYLWGHWWCCETCTKHMADAGIMKVYLPENAKILFKKD